MRRTTALVLLVFLSVQISGCMAWHTVSTPVEDLRPYPHELFRFTLDSIRSVEVKHVRLHDDSITGVRDSAYMERGEVVYRTDSITFPISSVTHVEHHVIDGALVATGLGAFALLAAVTLSNMRFGGQ